MSQFEKLTTKLLSKPNDFTWDEPVKVLNRFGYIEVKKGKTGGSRRKFADATNHIINLHKPHPGNILKRYQIDQVVGVLKERGKLKDE